MSATVESERPIVFFKGADRRGVFHHGGASDESPAELVERLFQAGWRQLTAYTRKGWVTTEVGAIFVNESHHRTWWAET